MGDLDRALFRWVNRWPEELSPLFHFFSEAIKTLPVRVTLLLLIVGLIVAGGKWRRAALLALLAWPLANATTDVLKYAFKGLRPMVDYPDVIERVNHLTSYGTASAHAANMAACAFVFTSLLGWWGGPWVLIALLTGIARIYVGAHYPSQVLLGWLVGTFCGFLVVRTWDACSKIWNRAKQQNADADHQPQT